MPSGKINFQLEKILGLGLKISAHSRTVAQYLDTSLTEEQVSTLADQLSIKKMKSNPAVNHEDRHAKYLHSFQLLKIHRLRLRRLVPKRMSGQNKVWAFGQNKKVFFFERKFQPHPHC